MTSHMAEPNPVDLDIIGTLPSRWLRMDTMSQHAVLEVGRALQNAQIDHFKPECCGIIGGSQFGSLATDLAYARSLQDGVAFASPALFGYTLANISLAEAASQYNITGPVFCVLDPEPLQASLKEAKRWLNFMPQGSFILYGELDVIPEGNEEHITASFHIQTQTP
jgi:hypothetical protein